MTAEAFVDTNILLYAISGAKADRHKKGIATQLLTRRDLGMSAQVFGEFYVNATRKQKPPLAHEEAVLFLRSLARFPIAEITSDTVFRALELKHRFQISYWDACIIAAAESLKCKRIYSEDLQGGQRFGEVIVINPF